MPMEFPLKPLFVFSLGWDTRSVPGFQRSLEILSDIKWGPIMNLFFLEKPFSQVFPTAFQKRPFQALKNGKQEHRERTIQE